METWKPVGIVIKYASAVYIQGQEHWISIQLDKSNHLSSFTITFQGGFAASKITFM